MWFKKRFIPVNGVLPDTRTEEEKALDYKQEELVTAPTPVVWTKKTTYRSFPVRKQNGSGSCVAQSTEKARGINLQQKYGKFIFTSATPTYALRANPAVSGSTKADYIKYVNDGSVCECLVPSQSMTDAQMNGWVKEQWVLDQAKVFGAKCVDIPIDIDTIASTIEVTGKGVCVWFRFGPGEWFGRKEVGIMAGSTLPWGHAVTAVDYTLNDKGEKCLVIEDSACEDGYPQRLVPESFLKARCFVCSYIVNFKTYQEVPDKPRFDGSVKSLQDCLKFEGLFPANQESTGVFGSITKSALIKFQLKYNIVPALGVFGDITKAKLFELYP